jgi:hypothetical protein
MSAPVTRRQASVNSFTEYPGKRVAILSMEGGHQPRYKRRWKKPPFYTEPSRVAPTVADSNVETNHLANFNLVKDCVSHGKVFSKKIDEALC